MGSGGSKQTKGKTKIPESNFEPEPEPVPELPQRKQRHNQLHDPHSERPVELSWLQQNKSNDNYNRINDHQLVHHDEHLRRIPIAIKRWPKDNEQIQEQKSKSFIEEYVRQ